MYLPIAGVEVSGWLLAILGFCVGVLGGFFGIGGAFMVTPALNIFGFPMAYAIGTDVAHIMGKSIVATFRHRKLGNVDLRLGVLMILGTAIGIECGAQVIMWLERIGQVGSVVRAVYIILLGGIGSYMLREYLRWSRANRGSEKKEAPSDVRSAFAQKVWNIKIYPMVELKESGIKAISLWVILGVGYVTGFLAGFLGVGGGFIRMPALIYVIGCPTTVAVGTDLFEVMFSGAYAAFTYGIKGRVEILGAIVMLCGAAIGAQFGTVATKYVKGMKIRFYFALTIFLAAVSVIFKEFAARSGAIYKIPLKKELAEQGFSKLQIENMLANRQFLSERLADNPQMLEAFQKAVFWENAAGVLMLGAAVAMSLIVIALMIKGILEEKKKMKAEEAA